MNKRHHPSNRAERLRIKYLKDTFDKSTRSPVKRKRLEIEEKELEDELSDAIARPFGTRIEVSGSEAKGLS